MFILETDIADMFDKAKDNILRFMHEVLNLKKYQKTQTIRVHLLPVTEKLVHNRM